VAALELARCRLGVNAVVPGFVDTPTNGGVLQDPDVQAQISERLRGASARRTRSPGSSVSSPPTKAAIPPGRFRRRRGPLAGVLK
jgi:NAD(P)-dependent dehydrogenase (short-subunit alcohol dehydrogenase family)